MGHGGKSSETCLGMGLGRSPDLTLMQTGECCIALVLVAFIRPLPQYDSRDCYNTLPNF